MTRRRLVIDSSEDGHSEICYNTLSLEEIESRIQIYGRKYGSYSQFLAHYCCCCSDDEETTISMDWECLIDERHERLGIAPAHS